MLTPVQLTTVFFLAVAGLTAILYAMTRLAQYITMRGGFADERLEALLMPLLHQAITTVYEMETHAFEFIDRAMEVADKREIARLTYGLLVDVTVSIPGLPLDVRLGALVTEEKWSKFVDSSFETMRDWTKWATKGLLRELAPLTRERK